jgi:hypothetical protein
MFKLDHGVDQSFLKVTPSLLVTVADSIKALADPAHHYNFAQPHRASLSASPMPDATSPPPTMTNLDTAAIRRKPVLNGLINAQAA